MPSIPKAFLSYSHDTQEHKKWTLQLATRLRNNGIDAILDQFELQAGDDLPHFMESNLASADKILMICTDKYVEKANEGIGGVGYEKMIITANLMSKINENKIIPIIRQTGGKSSVPHFLKTKIYIDFSKGDDFEFSYDELVRTIHKAPLFVKPPIGNSPFKPIEEKKLNGDIDFKHKVLTALIEEHNEEYVEARVENIAKRLGSSIVLTQIGLIKLVDDGYAKWTTRRRFITITDQGRLYAFQSNLITQ